MKRILFTGISTAVMTTAAYADPGHIEAAGHGHSHFLGYGIIVGIAALAAGICIIRANVKAKRA